MWLLFLVGAYAVIVVVMCLMENSLVYPLATAADYWEAPPEGVEEVTFTADGVTIHAWYLPHLESKEAILICHGNGGNLSSRGWTLARFRDHLGCSVLIFDYPGYGKSGGKPSESGCYAAAESALKWLAETKGIPNERVVLFGDSLGGGVATEIAKRRPCRALVLSKTFTNLPAVAGRNFWWLPVKYLMRNRFDNLSKIGEVHSPVFVAGATLDTLVPFEMSKQLHDAAPGPKEFMALEGEGHNDRLTDEFLTKLSAFLHNHGSVAP